MATPISNLTISWSNVSNTYTAIGINVSSNGYSSDSKFLNLKRNGSSKFSIDANGSTIIEESLNVGNVIICNTFITNNFTALNTISYVNLNNANVITANITTANIVTANITTSNIVTANITTANVSSLNVSSSFNATCGLNATSFVDNNGNVRDRPILNKSAIYELALADIGKTISTSANVYVPNTVFGAGNTLYIYNNSAASITVTQNTAVTMYLSGTSTTGNRTLAQRGFATLVCVAANNFVLSGTGVT